MFLPPLFDRFKIHKLIFVCLHKDLYFQLKTKRTTTFERRAFGQTHTYICIIHSHIKACLSFRVPAFIARRFCYKRFNYDRLKVEEKLGLFFWDVGFSHCASALMSFFRSHCSFRAKATPIIINFGLFQDN